MPHDIFGLIITALGGSGGLAMMFKAWLDRKNNVAAQEKEFNKGIIESLKESQLKYDSTYNELLDWKEYSSELIGVMLRNGLSRNDIPKAPDEE